MDDISSDEAILIEYLDGELSQEERQIVEERLAQEPELRKELVRLEASWEKLDLLERELSDDTLVEATIETVVAKTEESLKAIRIQDKYRRYGKGIMWGLLTLFVLLGAIVLGIRLAIDEPFAATLAAPVIERLDIYLIVLDEDPDFLPLLAQQRIFLPPQPEGSPTIPLSEYYAPGTLQKSFWEEIVPIPWSVYNPTRKSFFPLSIFLFNREFYRRIQRIDSFGESFYSVFYNNYHKFLEFSPEKKEKLRQLYKSIELSPRRLELIQTLHYYYIWQKSLQNYERAELRQPFSAEKQVERIAALKKRLDDSLPEQKIMPVVAEALQFADIARLSRLLETLPMSSKDKILDAAPNQTLNILRYLGQQNETEKVSPL